MYTDSLELKEKKRKELGRRIQLARIEAGYSQTQLSEILEVSDKGISSYEVGRTAPNFEMMQKISEALHKPLAFFDLRTETQEKTIEEKIFQIEKELNIVKELVTKQKKQ